jgi:hypothetical protein
MDKQNLIYAGIALGSAFISMLATAILTAPSDLEILDKCANMPAEQLKAAARTTTAQFKEVKQKADVLNARKTVILAVQDANS